jgi:serine/threonine-protein kinase
MKMDAGRWEQVQAVFNAALETPAAERDEFVAARCGSDTELLGVVRAMLDEERDGGSVLDRDMSAVADLVLRQQDDALPPQSQFGPYRVVRLLGAGGMGVVYLAERDDIGSRAAVKILRDAWLSPARRARFASEQRTLAKLSHASIARLYDAGALPDGTPWFVMEYVEGLTLTAYCNANHCSIRERLELFRSVCEAVMYAHAHAIIHRDLKPSNILVSQDGEVKLLDFGISKELDARNDDTDHTHTALRLMTPAYAAPEQLRGGAIGVQTDVYSLGVLLYELLAGRPPFDLSHTTPGEAEDIILAHEPERPSAAARRPAGDGASLAGDASRSEWADLDVLCLTAMHKDTGRRYRSVEALGRDVDNYLDGAPLDARPDSFRYTTAKFLRRNWRPVSGAAAALALTIGVAGFYTVRLTTARNAAISEAARTQRVQKFMLDLFQGGDAAAGPADSLRVVTLIDRGAREARSLTKDPMVQAELYATLGGIYRSLGRLDRADTLLNAALSERRALDGADSAGIAESMVALGMLRSDQARFDEAERLVRAGLALDRRVLPPNHPAIARATASLGEILENRGSYAEAITVLGQAIALERAHGDTTAELDEAMSELANTHFYLGHYATSDSINRRVLAMSRTLYGDRHPSVANDLINLGAIQFQWEHYKEAENYYRQALAINEEWYGTDNAEVASDLTMLARALTADSRQTEAAAMLRRALQTQERVYGRVHPRVASALNEIGTVALERKQYDEAADAFSRMISIYRTVYGDKHYLLATATGNLASVYMARRDFARAEPLFREAVRRFSDTQGPDHVNTGIALAKLGRCLLRERRYQEASEESLAAYNVLHKQTDPPQSFLRAVCTDLDKDYTMLKQPDAAAKYRAELAKIDSASGG